MNSLKMWLKDNLKGHQAILTAVTLCAITLPLSTLSINNIAFGLLVIVCVVNRRLLSFNRNINFYIPIFYYFLICISLIWSININESIKALSKEIGLLLFPLIFLFLPKFSSKDKKNILLRYSYAMALYSVFLLIHAVYRYIISGNIDVFFYHELVTLEINAIYISLIFSLAFLYLLRNNLCRWWDYLAVFILFSVIILLSSKNIIVITFLLAGLSFLTFKHKINYKLLASISVISAIILSLFGGKIVERFKAEFKDFNENIILENGVENVSIKNAIYQENFTLNHYFSGTSLRVYQARLLSEFIENDNIFWTGFGVNATQEKIIQKQKERGYQPFFGELNFHNQYLQSFAELGIIGFITFFILVSYSIYRAIITKDFDFLAFIVLIASLSISESIFSRQRGVVFFITFYCIYHHKKRNENAK